MITCSFDRWEPSTGWYVPNTTVPDQTTTYTTHGYAWYDTKGVLFPGASTPDLSKLPARRWDYLYDHPQVRYVLTADLGTDQRHLHLVCLHNPDYFQLQASTGLMHVSDRVMRDMRLGRSRLVFLMPYEATSGYGQYHGDLDILHDWCVNAGLGPDQVWFIDGDRKRSADLDGRAFNHLPVMACISWMTDHHEHPIAYEPIDAADIFLCYNRRGRPHRTLLMCELLRADILHRGLCSYHGESFYSVIEQIDHLARHELMPYARQLEHLRPMHLDRDLGTCNPVHDVVHDHVSRTLLSVVTETEHAGALFPTDKIFKVLCSGHPFMVVSSPGYLAMLRRLGYQTFARWWDESYDEEPNLHTRIGMIVHELRRLSDLSIDHRLRMRTEMQDVLSHNLALFNESHASATLQHPDDALYQCIHEIWAGFPS